MNIKEYKALLYLNNSPDSKPVSISIDGNNIKVEMEENMYLPVTESEFKIGGNDSDFLVVKNKNNTLFIKDLEILDELINNNSNELFSNLKQQHKKSKHGRKYTLIYILGILAILIFLTFLSFNLLTNIIAKAIPLSWEKTLGDAAVAAMSAGKTVNDEKLLKPVREIGTYLESKGNDPRYKFKFYVVKDDQINAFALPGGNVVVYTGLLKNSDSPEEVAGVLAHEIQHVYQRHGVKRVVKRFGISIFLSLMFGNIGGQLDQIGGELAGLKFDREEESEADRMGLQLLYNSGVDPNGMVIFFQKLKEMNKDLPEVLAFLSTHPATENRIEVLQKLIKEKYDNRPFKKEFNIDWKEVKEIAAKN